MPRCPADSNRRLRWRQVLTARRHATVATRFLTVPTITVRALSVSFVIDHGRRQTLYVVIAAHPAASWIAEQLRNHSPDNVPHFLILDNDAKSRNVELE
jgi:hypothetical protein